MTRNYKNFKTTSFLSEGSALEGVLTVKGGIRIDGSLKGRIHSESVVYLGDTADIEADIEAEAVISSGKVAGNIASVQQVQVNLPGSVKGSIETRELVLEKGVYFDGSCKITTPHR